jgi:hypothetical protein
VNAPEKVLSWIPDFSGQVTLATCSANTAFDTVLYVREDSPTGNEVACNDDTNGCGVSSGSPNSGRHGSSISMNVIAGQTYYVVVDGFSPSSGASEGAFELSVTPTGGSTPTSAQPDSGTTDANTPVTIDVLSNDSPPSGGSLLPSTVTVTSAASNGSTSVDPINGMITYTPNLDYSGGDAFTYEVFDDQGGSDTAVVTITINGSSNVPDIPPGGGLISGSTSGASVNSGTCASASANAPEQVYAWVPNVSGTVTLETCSSNTEFDTVLYVRAGSSTGGEIACNDDTIGCAVNSGSINSSRHGSRVNFSVVAGQTYYVFVDAYRPSSGASEGNFELTVIPATP